MKSCGIDLGTTNSCVYVVEPSGPRLISDEHGKETFPSVVYMGKDRKAWVGHAAKNRMGELNGPVATIKRKMGSNETVVLGKEKKSPIEISTIILRFLKGLAEAAVGEEVDRAVVTVPAYFGHIQRQHTDEAATKAGFREVTTLLEPVAAALAYSLASDRPRLRVFVYDLGGGTFDATVLEKDDQGGLNVLSFGGDPYLGGDNFDARIARLLIGKLTAKGYKLDLDLQSPEDFSRYQRMKFHAEAAKIHLTDHESVDMAYQGLFQDQNGDTVDLDLTLTRQEVEECCEDLVARSVHESLETLKKNQIELSSIDEVIMVGGMARMPLVRRRLEEALGHAPQLVDPDLIVARGAALKAAQLYPDRAAGAGGLELDLRYDRSTEKLRTRLTGVFNRTVSDHTIYLIDDREERYERVSGSDRFTFDNIELRPDSENTFALSVENEDGETVLEREIKITHDSRGTQILSTPGSVVTKTISVWTLDGPQAVFPENTALPHFASCTFHTADQTGQINMPIMEGNHEVERLMVREIPKDLAVGTPVLVEVSVEADYRIKASASVPSISRKVDISFHIDAVDTSTLTAPSVAKRLGESEDRGKKAAHNCPSPQEVEIFWVRFKSIRSEIEMELTEAEPDRLKIHEKLGGLSALIRNVSQREAESQLKPDFADFSKHLSDIETQAIETKHPDLPEVRPRIERLRDEAQQAWRNKDRIAWVQVNNQLPGIAQALLPKMSQREWAEGLAGFIIVNQIPEIRRAGGSQSETEVIEQEVVTTMISLQTGGVSPDSAVQQLMKCYHQRVAPLRKRLNLDTVALDKPLASGRSKEGYVRLAK